MKLIISTVFIALLGLVTANPIPLSEASSKNYISPFDHEVVSPLGAARDYESLRGLYAPFWNEPGRAEGGVCETTQASPPTDEALGAIEGLAGRPNCCQWNRMETQCSGLANRGEASVGFCGAYKACIECSSFARDRLSAIAVYCAWRDPSGRYRSGGKWMLDGSGPGARLILYHG